MQPSASEIGTWMLVFGFLLSAGASLAVILNTRKVQRRSVSLEETFATVPQLEKVASDLEEWKGEVRRNGETRKDSIEGKVEALRLEVKRDVGELHEKMNDLSRDVSAVAKNCEMTNQTVNGMTSQILRLAERGRG